MYIIKSNNYVYLNISVVEPWFRSVSIEQLSLHMVKVKVMQFLYRSGQTLRVPGSFKTIGT
jgi:hypothetical protein